MTTSEKGDRPIPVSQSETAPQQHVAADAEVMAFAQHIEAASLAWTAMGEQARQSLPPPAVPAYLAALDALLRERKPLALPAHLHGKPFVRLEFQLGDEAPHRLERQRFSPDDATAGPRDAQAAELVRRISWLTSTDGQRLMADRNYSAFSVASAGVEIALTHAAESGMSPLQVLEHALRTYSSTYGGKDIDAVRRVVTAVLDEAKNHG